MEIPPQGLLDALHRMGLLKTGEIPRGCMLSGGVSSDIWRIELLDSPICVKRALPRLKVAAEWNAPVERNLFEARWIQWAARVCPGSVPDLLGQDIETGALAMSFLAPDLYPVWKTELQHGHTDEGFAAAVGRRLGALHAASAVEPTLQAAFPTDSIFYEIRLAPYLLATAERHPDRANALRALVASIQANQLALIHGDVSPKNILLGPSGPVFLDAECAWWGDPAFDLAFCLNHLLLKCLWVPSSSSGFLTCFTALAASYLGSVTWENRSSLEERAAHLLPALMLARVDGKSPVEYITAERDRERVRRFARHLLACPAARLSEVQDAWVRELET